MVHIQTAVWYDAKKKNVQMALLVGVPSFISTERGLFFEVNELTKRRPLTRTEPLLSAAKAAGQNTHHC